MGGKGGGGGNYYQQPVDKSGNSTVEEATKTLANTAPVDMSKIQSNIDVKKAAAAATAKPQDTVTSVTAPAEGVSGTETTKDTTGDVAKKAVLTPPKFWEDYGKDPNTTNTQV
jgi:hypothetical protein